MNAINVISPYKLHGQWVFDDPRVGWNRSLPAPIPGSTGWSLTLRMRSKDSRLSFPARLFQDISFAWIGGAKRAVAIGIIPPISTWRAGCARPCCAISLQRQRRFMPR
jgi:hypothetical protein